MSVSLACPAAAVVHPVLSLNANDIECGVAGHARPAEGSPCVDAMGYIKCSIWKTAKDIEKMGHGKRVLANKTYNNHDLGGTVKR